jgi:hypothetical protein
MLSPIERAQRNRGSYGSNAPGETGAPMGQTRPELPVLLWVTRARRNRGSYWSITCHVASRTLTWFRAPFGSDPCAEFPTSMGQLTAGRAPSPSLDAYVAYPIPIGPLPVTW